MTTPILISDNNEQLNGILKDQRFADKKVCVVSVAGAFRTGKSFMLNFFLRYLRAQATGTENWMDMDGQLGGFSWRDGVNPDTQGILVWPELFLLKDCNGEEVVVILMDTQGINGSDSTFKNCVNIFALSTMISSVQVFNIQNKIEETHLDQLKYFTNYAQLALKNNNNGTAPYQSLLFLVRDWCNLRDAEYGAIGGQKYLDKLLEIESKEHELQQLRRDIRSTFDNIHCFLMPHPGLEMITNPDFRGELEIINAQFKAQLSSLVTHLFHPNNLVVKQINGHPINCSQLADYINAYSKLFQGTDLPEPMTAFTAMANFTNSVAVDNAKAVYEQGMETVYGGDKPFLSDDELRAGHERYRAMAFRDFNTNKMGGIELEAQFDKKLDKDIQEAFKSVELSNDNKKKTAETANLATIESAKALYKRKMEKVCGEGKPFINGAILHVNHERCRNKTLNVFRVKMIGGSELEAQFVEKLNGEIKEAFKSFELINDNKKQTADATNSAAVDSAIKVYKREMEKICGRDVLFLSVADLGTGHERCRAVALSAFDAEKMGGPELETYFVMKLEEGIQEAFKSFALINDNKKQTADATNSTTADSAKAVYKREMGKVCCGNNPLSVAQLGAGHERCRANALRTFDDKKMGGPELTKQFVEKLEADIQEAFEAFERSNKCKETEQRERERAEREKERADKEQKEKAEKERKAALLLAMALTGGPIGALAAGGLALADHLLNKDDKNKN